VDWNHFAQKRMVLGSFEHNIEALGSVNFREFLDHLSL
jgi:hypothetical protein